jgi:hypothetical protein
MKLRKVRCALLAACVMGGVALAAPEETTKDEVADDESVARWSIDLRTGAEAGDGPLEVIDSGPSPENAALLAVVVKVDLTGLAGLRVRATYGAPPKGMTLNVGDSATNDGFAGDGCTQSRDAETHVSDGSLLVFGNDHTPQHAAKDGHRLLRTIDGLVGAGTELVLTVRDESLEWAIPALNRRDVLRSPCLFALGGQEDTEGRPNQDVFVAANRCIAGDYRAGSGVVKLVLEPLTR